LPLTGSTVGGKCNLEISEIRVGKFKVLRRLGRGGMGAVYEGYDPALDRRVAIKTLTTDAISDEDSRGRFEREARAAAKLQHPNIVTVYELGNFGRKEKPYIVMEYLEGSDVASLVSEGKGLSLAEALNITVQLCHALDFAHQRGVVHRDVKPSNIRYLDDGGIKIMDFGIARIEGGDQITRSGVMVGTPHYMSPEQIKGEGVDGRSDVFSAGCILYELLAGTRPFQGDSATTILYKIVNDQPSPVLEFNPDLPQEIQDILNRALAKKPCDRFQTADEMAAELEKLLGVYQKSFPRPSTDVRSRLDILERLLREEKWADVIPLAQKLTSERPELDLPQRALRRAYREQRRVEDALKITPEERTRHLAEISQEFQALYGPASQPTVVDEPAVPEPEVDPTAGELKLRTKTGAEAVSATGSRAVKLTAVIGLVVALVVLGWVYLPEVLGPREIAHTVLVSSQPPGAAIFVNGKDSGRSTKEEGPVEFRLEGIEGDSFTVELRRDGYASVSTLLTLGEEPPSPVRSTLAPLPVTIEVVTRPTGASVQLDGVKLPGTTPMEVELEPREGHELVVSKDEYESETVNIAAGGEFPAEEIVLKPVTKPGTLVVTSAYPLSVLSSRGDKLVERSTNPTIRLGVGRHSITLYAPEVFLNRVFTVDIREASQTEITAPALGKVSIRASPGNCRVTINDVAAEALPIDNKDIVAGTSTFVFEWPSGQRDEQTEEVRPGRHAYVTGRVR
jgi:serine/threonine protein kinase